ncbi:conserved hypothetical protein [Amycolatopsis xylanica]|uniref:DUF4440 domain-containing protein n=1 Tax=Amycolatopsis xylanica TaxID=589385 RepID=A0A1H3MZ97_9PSEU|nr:SgcJ/EcaC family oxidoreductase [Amycolatopsis xylanica]SDY81803.1 conserved hypothetical protein [Amycolatopsis xylanica]
MRKLLVGMAVLVAATGIVTASAAAEPAGHGDQAAFDRVRDAQITAWAKGDGAAFAATFTADADLITFNGDYLKTREGIAKGMQYYFDNFIKGSKIKAITEHVRYLEPDTVIIVRDTCLINAGEADCRDGSLSRNANVLVKQRGRWLQASFQNTRVVPLGS